MFDRRDDRWARRDAWCFKITFTDSTKTTQANVNKEYSEEADALVEAIKYGKALGRMPKILRRDVDTLTIHKGMNLWGGRNRDILIHTGHSEEIYEKRYGHILEETMMHEGAHTSMDSYVIYSQKWADAVKEDGKYISNYAREHPLRESVAETYVVWFATRCRKSRFTADKL